MPRLVLLSSEATRQLQKMRARDRSLLREALQIHLADADATIETRHRFRLRRPSSHADYELRIEKWRVFYRVVKNRVQVALIGRKQGNALIVDGRRFTL